MPYTIRYGGDTDTDLIAYVRSLAEEDASFYVEVQFSNQPAVAGFLKGVVQVAAQPYIALQPTLPFDQGEGPVGDVLAAPVLIDPGQVNDLYVP